MVKTLWRKGESATKKNEFEDGNYIQRMFQQRDKMSEDEWYESESEETGRFTIEDVQNVSNESKRNQEFSALLRSDHIEDAFLQRDKCNEDEALDLDSDNTRIFDIKDIVQTKEEMGKDKGNESGKNNLSFRRIIISFAQAI